MRQILIISAVIFAYYNEEKPSENKLQKIWIFFIIILDKQVKEGYNSYIIILKFLKG